MDHKTLYNHSRDRLRRFASPEAFAAHIDALPHDAPAYWRGYNTSNDSWSNNRSGAQALASLKNGSTEHLAAAEAILDQLRVEGILSSGVQTWQASVTGAFPNVPNAIANIPDAMMRRVQSDIASISSPLHIVVQVDISGGVSTAQSRNRGVAVLGLVLALQQLRPVTVSVFSNLDPALNGSAHASLITLESAPLDLDRATYMLCNVEFPRQLCYGIACESANLKRKMSLLKWGWNTQPTYARTIASVRDMLQLTPEDIYIPGGHLSDSLMLNNPVEWVKQQLVKQGVDVPA
jgi:hypothetical protein